MNRDLGHSRTGFWEGYLDVKGDKMAREIYLMGGGVICMHHQIILGCLKHGGWDGQAM